MAHNPGRTESQERRWLWYNIFIYGKPEVLSELKGKKVGMSGFFAKAKRKQSQSGTAHLKYRVPMRYEVRTSSAFESKWVGNSNITDTEAGTHCRENGVCLVHHLTGEAIVSRNSEKATLSGGFFCLSFFLEPSPPGPSP